MFWQKDNLSSFLGTWISNGENISKDGDSRFSAGTCDKVLITLVVKKKFPYIEFEFCMFDWIHNFSYCHCTLLWKVSWSSLYPPVRENQTAKKTPLNLSLFFTQTQFPLFLLLHLVLLLPIQVQGSSTLTASSESPSTGLRPRLSFTGELRTWFTSWM